MITRAEIVLDVVKNDRLYRFSVTNGSPFADAIEVLKELEVAVQQLSIQSQANEQKPEDVAPVAPEESQPEGSVDGTK